MIDIRRHVRSGMLLVAAASLLAGCHGPQRPDMARLPGPAQDYLLVSTYFMAEGSLVSRLQDGGLSGQQVYDMATSLKYGKHTIMTVLQKPSRRARREGQQAVALMVACANQPDPSTLNGVAPPRCLPGAPLMPVNAKGQVQPPSVKPAPR
ncbi:hypothetical protein CFR75_05315 [Komagataeibacter xylinus]|uniref:Uncharacterized protein n=1 Tax=Komagataeibacter xylinus TaxID=28448 RepID=A0A318PJP6_KOMXY|nr:hypothetical protein [Komagataeibacter xylinus]AZV39784.1 hypothetical protein CXP35_14415 [Komagataeibacter xylinus]PYD57671.1 hypothetical protein CFR75_05315 [Komagataeibacter xylinus]